MTFVGNILVCRDCGYKFGERTPSGHIQMLLTPKLGEICIHNPNRSDWAARRCPRVKEAQAEADQANAAADAKHARKQQQQQQQQ